VTIKVVELKYFGGQDDDLGGFLEAIKIEKPDEFLFPVFILHEMKQRRNQRYIWPSIYHGLGNWVVDEKNPRISEHRMSFYITEAELLKAHELAWAFLAKDQLKVQWYETDSVCGLKTSPDEFYRNRAH